MQEQHSLKGHLGVCLFMFTWNCASSKDIEAVQQNSEIDLKTNQNFSYDVLLEDLSLKLKYIAFLGIVLM